MTHKVRTLVVDDSVVIRRLLTDILSAEPDVEVVGAAASGAIALARIPQVNPDIITLDVEMPEMSGLETLVAIRRLYPKLPVVMFSSLTEQGAAAALEALARGATDYVLKPSGTGGREAAVAYVRAQLIPRLRALGKAPRPPVSRVMDGATSGTPRTSTRPLAHVVTRSSPPSGPPCLRPVGVAAPRVDVLAVGASTGGPNALSAFLGALPRAFPVPVVVVQHMPPVFTKLLADRLSAAGPLVVTEAHGGEILEPGHAYLAPGDHHMTVFRSGLTVRLAIHQGPQENSCRPAVDVMFRSVAATFGAGTLAVVLTGMGQDGLRGCEQIRSHGGQVVVQDEATSVVWGMPGFVAGAGLANAVLPLPQIAGEVFRRVLSLRGRSSEKAPPLGTQGHVR